MSTTTSSGHDLDNRPRHAARNQQVTTSSGDRGDEPSGSATSGGSATHCSWSESSSPAPPHTGLPHLSCPGPTRDRGPEPHERRARPSRRKSITVSNTNLFALTDRGRGTWRAAEDLGRAIAAASGLGVSR